MVQDVLQGSEALEGLEGGAEAPPVHWVRVLVDAVQVEGLVQAVALPVHGLVHQPQVSHELRKAFLHFGTESPDAGHTQVGVETLMGQNRPSEESRETVQH